jgi:hypothetical protein
MACHPKAQRTLVYGASGDHDFLDFVDEFKCFTVFPFDLLYIILSRGNMEVAKSIRTNLLEHLHDVQQLSYNGTN